MHRKAYDLLYGRNEARMEHSLFGSCYCTGHLYIFIKYIFQRVCL